MCSTTTFQQWFPMNGMSYCVFLTVSPSKHVQESLTRVLKKLENEYIIKKQLRLWFNGSSYDYLKELLYNNLKNDLTIVSLVYSLTQRKCHALKSFLKRLIKNELDDLRVESDSKRLPSHPTIAGNMNGVTTRSHTQRGNTFSDTRKPNLLAENANRTSLTESETYDICKAIATNSSLVSYHSSAYNLSSFPFQQSSSFFNISSLPSNSSPLPGSLASTPSSLSFPLNQSSNPSSSLSLSQCLPSGIDVSMGQRSHCNVRFSDQSTQTEEKFAVESKGTQISLSLVLEEKQSVIASLEEVVSTQKLKLERSQGSLVVTENEHKKEMDQLLKENKLLKNKVVALENEVVCATKNMKVTSLQLEHKSLEYDKLVNERRKGETLNEPLSSNHITSLNPLVESSSLIPSQQRRKESRTRHTLGSVSLPHKSSSRELQSLGNEVLGPARQKTQNLLADTHCEKSSTVPYTNGSSNGKQKDYKRWKILFKRTARQSSSTENSSSQDQPDVQDHGPLTVSHGEPQDDQQFHCSHHKMEKSKGCTMSIDNNKANNSSKLPDCLTCCSPISQEDKQRSNGNIPSKLECVNMTVNGGAQNANIAHQDDEVWLCHHYKRRCFVKFYCCQKFWPCHRCHNNKSTCGVKRLKSCDTQWIKCASCDTEKEFDKNSQHCTKCNKKFSEFFCAICKNLTGMDDNPYHCDKCGICRIRSNRSFHCDVCGVCLDVQLKGKHKCRSGSAHDECCICLEDAFSGCQILPCSHKVHKECATKMIRSGITCCPVCRESFAHKLQKKA